jgi:membrane-associated HD superfamily phosphohydrolase
VAIISLADIVESATRSLKNPTEDQLRDMINDLINKRILEGHLDGSG